MCYSRAATSLQQPGPLVGAARGSRATRRGHTVGPAVAGAVLKLQECGSRGSPQAAGARRCFRFQVRCRASYPPSDAPWRCGAPQLRALCPSLFGPNAPPEPLSGARSPPHTRVLYWHQKYGSMSQAWHGSQIRCLIDTVRTVSMRQRNTILAPRREDQLVHLIGCTVLDLLGRIGHERGHADDRRRDHDAGDKDDHV